MCGNMFNLTEVGITEECENFSSSTNMDRL